MRRSFLAGAAPAALSAVFLALSAFAEAQDAVLAESLFREGKRLLLDKNYAAACPKLAESHRQEPATGTLLALAMCHEAEGKIASAWAEYADVLGRAKKEHRSDREQAGREGVERLEDKLSTLTVTVDSAAAKLSGFEVKRDGVGLGSGSWGSPFPVDGGEHFIEAHAPGKKNWKIHVNVGRQTDHQVVSIPQLENAIVPPELVAPIRTNISVVTPKPEEGTTSSLKIVGLSVAGAGVVAAGLGSYFGVQALNKKARAGCEGNACPNAFSTQELREAKSDATTATWAFAAGGALLTGGVVMYLLGGSSAQKDSARIGAIPAVGASSLGVFVHGRFQ